MHALWQRTNASAAKVRLLAPVALIALGQLYAGSGLAQEAQSALSVPSASNVPSILAARPDTATLPAWPQAPAALRGAPHVLLILTDDVGFGASSAFGGPIPTPVYEDLARRGLRYNQYQNSAICSATRAALLTGRNPHNVGMGRVTNAPTQYPGYTGFIPSSAGSIAQVLRHNGFRTAAFGKWHLIPDWEEGPTGPFDRWPTGMGFQDFYGFIGADTDQYHPGLFIGTTPIDPPDEPGYILDRDLADHATSWIRQQTQLAPDKPFFVYYAPASTHAPHQAPKDWIARFKGRFDAGWDAIREETFRRQKAMGIIPRSAQLTLRPAFLPAWTSLSADQKRLYAHMMEVYAAQLAYSDAQIGRLIDALRDSGKLDNTLIIFSQGDNGASAEGGADGSLYEQAFMNRFPEPPSEMLAHLDDFGSDKAYNNYPAGWAWAMDTPFRYYKQTASHLGGVRNDLVISWPKRIADTGKVRPQFHFVADIMPTILEAAGIAPPDELDGVAQKRLDGISMTYTFDNGAVPSRRTTQVFETMQNLGIYQDGWWAGTVPVEAPWDFFKPDQKQGNGERAWQLFNLTADYSQANDLAAAMPAKLQAMKALFMEEAARNNILPIHPPSQGAGGRPSSVPDRSHFLYRGTLSRLPTTAAPDTTGHSFVISADVVTNSGTKGVVVTHGGRFGGYALYFRNGLPVFHYNALGAEQYEVHGDAALPPGPHIIQVDFAMDGRTPGSSATFTLTVDGRTVDRGYAKRTIATRNALREGMDIGRDTLTPITDDYTVPESIFTGKVNLVDIAIH